MNIQDKIIEIDRVLTRAVCNDILSGTFLVEADDETLEMVLIDIWDMRSSYTRAGVIIADA